MTSTHQQRRRNPEYGARAVSVDIARGRSLITRPAAKSDPPPPVKPLPPTHAVVADRLALAHWTPGHRIVVCSLAGGTGRTTVAGLMATVLAELPYAHVWRPIGLVEASRRTLSSTYRRWGVTPFELPTRESAAERSLTTAAGAQLLTDLALEQSPNRDHSAVVVEARVGMPSDLALIDGDPDASVVLVCRPDRTSLVEAAEALVWMHDQGLVNRRRITVVLNHGAGATDRGSAAAATALGIRCAAIHSLPRDRTLAPGRTIPSGRELPARLRRPVNRLCLDIWTNTQDPIPAPADNSRSQEHS